MRDLLVLVAFMALIGGAILAGRPREPVTHGRRASAAVREFAGDSGASAPAATTDHGIPSIGSVQVLNGCGIDLAGVQVADYLRSRGFDVKNVDNAPTWNYPATIVVSRTRDTRNARRVADALSTEKVILLRTGDEHYDVVVIVGPDYQERIR